MAEAQSKQWEAAAPSNIALIKYMGKTEVRGNLPSNSSLSYTLSHLKSHVRLSLNSETLQDSWSPLVRDGLLAPDLSEKGKSRFLNHLLRIKTKLAGERFYFKVESANDFPSDCGLASSASSFAALTKVTVLALSELLGRPAVSIFELADLSRQASGSSCRSFFDEWALWEGAQVEQVAAGYQNLRHLAVLVESDKKLVSSSEAHLRVVTSKLFDGRPARADDRKTELLAALRAGNWYEAYQISWAEFWDMHALFETSLPAFSYMTPGSLKVLRYCQEIWVRDEDGPLVTMDAGANVHLLFRSDQGGLHQEMERELSKSCRVMSSGGHSEI